MTQYDIRVYKAEDGLPYNSAKAVFQDSRSYIWIAGQEGLVRFDGVLFKRFDKSGFPSLTDDFIWDVKEDKAGRIWIATQSGGVGFLDGSSFTMFDTTDGLASNSIREILICKDSSIWFGGVYGLTIYKNGIFRKITSLGHRAIESMVQDQSGRVFVCGWYHGYYVGDSVSDPVHVPATSEPLPFVTALSNGDILFGSEFGVIYMLSGDSFQASSIPPTPQQTVIRGILEDDDHSIWFTTQGEGIFRWSSGRVENLRVKTGLPGNNDFFTRMLKDREGNLWFVSDGGVYRFLNNKFNPFGLLEGFNGSYAHSVCEDVVSGDIWVGLRDGGVVRIMDNEGRNYDVSESGSLQGINAIFPRDQGGVWVASPTGVSSIDDQGRIRQFGEPLKRHGFGIASICKSSRGGMWMGRTSGFVYYFDGSNFETFDLLPRGEATDVISILEQRNGRLWIGTRNNGLHFYEKGQLSQNGVTEELRSEGINALRQDTSGAIWIASDGKGLFRFKNSEFKSINTIHGMAFDRLFSVVEDDFGRLWFSGNQGIFSVKKKEIEDVLDGRIEKVVSTLYGNLDGMREAECNGRKQPNAWKKKDGSLWFCGVVGVSSIDPANMPVNRIPPVTHIEGISVNEQALRKYQDGIYEFSAEERNVEITYTALSFSIPERVQFKYRLEGFDDQWVDAGSRRQAFYTNLPKGPYTFKVIAANNDGFWNEEGATVSFSIAPFWYETWWAFSLYGIGFITLTYSIREYELKRIHLRNELKLREARTEKLEEMDRVKSNFFANISHEFRTPLTLILGPLVDIRSGRLKGNLSKEYLIMERNARRLLKLINELLDLSALDAGKLKLHANEGDIVLSVRSTVNMFESLATQKEVELVFEAKQESLSAFFDRDKLEVVMNNLLSNAFKFTPRGGRIAVRIGVEKDLIVVCIANTGQKTTPDQRAKMFERFYHSDGSGNEELGGSGIGLALTKELVELHHGNIVVLDQDGETQFVFSLPIGRNHLKEDEITTLNTRTYSGPPGVVVPVESSPDEVPNDLGEGIPRLLIVEDNPDMRGYLRRIVGGSYTVLEAKDGEEGLRMALSELPDIVISDVMMPMMTGFELCTALKQDTRTSHIPLIMLTARASSDDKISGLETGADDYVIKPFGGKELLVRIRNLLDQREKLKEKFRQQIIIQPSEIAVTSADQQFLHKAISYLEENMADPDLTIERLADQMGMSRMTLHRKLTALTGQNAGRFILMMRLKRAAHLLGKKAGTVSEIAYSVGFNHLSYFSKCFRTEFGKLPIEYMREQSKGGI